MQALVFIATAEISHPAKNPENHGYIIPVSETLQGHEYQIWFFRR
jgi:hypothetical protein